MSLTSLGRITTPEYPRISDYPSHWARNFPTREAVVLDGSRLTYAELSELVDRCARGLLDKGIKAGDRVAMLSNPRPEFWIVFLATVRIGAIWLGLNPKYTAGELRYVVGDAQPVLLITPDTIEGRHFGDEARQLAAEVTSIREIVVLCLQPCDHCWVRSHRCRESGLSRFRGATPHSWSTPPVRPDGPKAHYSHITASCIAAAFSATICVPIPYAS
jgi:non-ribosomal peptide synthetase component E (peptide arylation enzyme)